MSCQHRLPLEILQSGQPHVFYCGHVQHYLMMQHDATLKGRARNRHEKYPFLVRHVSFKGPEALNATHPL